MGGTYYDTGLNSEAANVARSYRRQLAHLPPPGERWRRQHLDPAIDDALFRKADVSGLIQKAEANRGCAERCVWTTSEGLWQTLKRWDVIDDDGEVILECGTDGPLPCGSPAFTNVGGGKLECKHCGERYQREAIQV